MKQKISTLVLGTVLLLLNGCGGGGSTTDTTSAVDTTPSNNSLNPILYRGFSSTFPQQIDSLLRTDGTATGTSIVSSIMATGLPDQNFQYEKIDNMQIVGDKLYFNAIQSHLDTSGFLPVETVSIQTFQTLMSDGTTTDIGLNVNLSLDSATAHDFVQRAQVGNTLYTIVSATGGGYKLVEIDTVNGTTTDLTIPAPYIPYLLNTILTIGTDIYLGVVDSSVNSPTITDYKVIKYDTVAGTFDTNIPGLNQVYMQKAITDGNKIYFSGVSGVSPMSFFSYDITTPNTSPAQLTTDSYVIALDFLKLNGQLYHSVALNNSVGILKIDLNNPVFTTVITNNAAADAQYAGVYAFNNAVYMISDNKLFYLNGSTLSDVSGGNLLPKENNAVEMNGKLYFSCSSASTGTELCQYDGTTVSIAEDINPGSAGSQPNNLTLFNGNLIFQASPDGIQNKLYQYDGTGLTVLFP